MKTRIVVVLKRSAYTKWVEEERDPRVEKLILSGDASVRKLVPSHQAHEETVNEVVRAVKTLGIDAEFIHCTPGSEPIPEASLVVTVGGDGTLLTASHDVGRGVPILGINSAPDYSVGFFCAGMKGDVLGTLERALAGQLPRIDLTRMEVQKDGVTMSRRVLNEALFCHTTPAATARYIFSVHSADITTPAAPEEQKSSGIWIGPAAGSTAAQRSAGGAVLPLASTSLQYVVREPYAPLGERFGMTKGVIGPNGWFELRSRMRQGKVFLDGEHVAFDVTIGEVLTFRVSNEPLTILGLPKGEERGTARQ